MLPFTHVHIHTHMQTPTHWGQNEAGQIKDHNKGPLVKVATSREELQRHNLWGQGFMGALCRPGPCLGGCLERALPSTPGGIEGGACRKARLEGWFEQLVPAEAEAGHAAREHPQPQPHSSLRSLGNAPTSGMRGECEGLQGEGGLQMKGL